MRRARASVLLVCVWLALFGVWLPLGTPSSAAQDVRGHVVAVVGRQIGLLNFEAPRPRILTGFVAPGFAQDVAAVPSSPLIAVSVATPFGSTNELGGDVLGVDLTSLEQAPVTLVARTDAGEWLGAPAWLPDGSALLFQREDLRAGSDLNAGQAAVRYPSRIEMASASGAGRVVVIADGHHPSPSLDGSEVAFVRLSPAGPLLLARHMHSGQERVLVPAGRLPDLAYPRYSPDGERIAFMATGASALDNASGWVPLPTTALAHGVLWNLWLVERDGSGVRELSDVGADDASVCWSPDGSQLFVYGSTGARVVNAANGEAELLPFIAGFGATSWLP